MPLPKVGRRVRHSVHGAFGRAIAPRVPLTTAQWADAHMVLSEKSTSRPGRWRTSANPPLREPMECMSSRSSVRDVALMFPAQFGKTAIALNTIGYVMDHAPGPLMVALPGEVTFNKWINQKLNPTLESCERMQSALSSTASRDSSNQRAFKDFTGGQLFLEHAGSPGRLKLATIKILIVDELDEFSSNYRGGDDPIKMLDGRTTSFDSSRKRLYISTPSIEGVSRIKQLWDKSDQRRFHVACPHCDHMQPLEWGGLHWNDDCSRAWYACRECGVAIEEHHKTQMIASGQWVAAHPERKLRGYHINALYFQFGLGPRWHALAQEWKEAQGDPAKLKTFVNDRLAETWEDQSMRAVKHNLIIDRAEPRPARPVPWWVLATTAGIDTQDNRLAVQRLGWGRNLRCWPIDYVELPGDPAEDDVWVALTQLLLQPIEHEWGGMMRLEAAAIDIAGHRTEAVKAYVRRSRALGIRRLLAIFGAVPNNAPVLGKGKLQDINWKGQLDRKGVHIHAVGTVGIKHLLYSRLSTDADKEPEDRLIRFSDEFDTEYFGGLVAEIYNPTKNRFEKRAGAPRNEPLDTWGYGYAATHHPELRLQRATKADWDAREARLKAYRKADAATDPGHVEPDADSRETSNLNQPVDLASSVVRRHRRRTRNPGL